MLSLEDADRARAALDRIKKFESSPIELLTMNEVLEIRSAINDIWQVLTILVREADKQ